MTSKQELEKIRKAFLETDWDAEYENSRTEKDPPEYTSKCCGKKLIAIHKPFPSNPVFGQTYYCPPIYYYCEKCGLMYSAEVIEC